MNQEQAEFVELQTEAFRLLRDGTIRQRFLKAAHALVLPSFDDAVAYEVLSPGRRGGRASLGVKTVWRRTLDIQKFRTPVERLRYGAHISPTIETAEIHLPQDFIDALLSRARKIRVPLCVSGSVSLDGTSFELYFGGGFEQARFKWSNAPPPGWEPLQDVLSSIQVAIESGLSDRPGGPASPDVGSPPR